jgi:hypothetical protein
VNWALIIIVTVLLVLISHRDEPLSEEAQALLAVKPADVPDRENIFVAMAGFDAPEGQDMFEAGRSDIDNVKVGENQETARTRKRLEGRKTLQWRETEPPFDCEFGGKADYLSCLRGQKDRLEKTLAANATLIQRYRMMQGLPRYAVQWSLDAQFSLDGYRQLMQAQKALMAQAMLDMATGNEKAGLIFFEKDMAFWRLWLENKGRLFDSMVALGGLAWRDARGLSFLLSSPVIRLEGQEKQWREWLTPLTHEQYSFRPALEGEFRVTISGLPKEARAVFFNLNTPLFLPNATANRYFLLLNPWFKLADLPWQDYLERRDKALALSENLSKPGINWVYNPTGKIILFSAGSPDYDKYIGGHHNGSVYLRLVRLQLELRLAEVPPEKIPDFIRQQGEACCAPSSDFSWDAKTHTLSFEPYGDKHSIPHSVKILEASAMR